MRPIIRSVLEQHLTELNPFNTVWEGIIDSPKLPYQTVSMTTSTNETASIGNAPKAKQSGFFQVTLYYPLDQGTKAIEERADEICRHFFGQVWIEDNVQILVQQPPLVASLHRLDNSIALPVTIYFSAYEL
ncbi:phage tail terminator-like protein [Mannheimia haemolytica]|uniref:phage tail terminator-like protein n=1 Tax=Mannheimia haemolytica TaxID=75985 RepID=UPI001CF44EDD|nr:phage tail terminator-like protein [Mannheimia haemolytica]MCB4228114.1 DUF4128 domain-containing protein [Mannheimia haemolytica]